MIHFVNNRFCRRFRCNFPWAMQPRSLDSQALEQTAPFLQRLHLCCWDCSMEWQHGMAQTPQCTVLCLSPTHPDHRSCVQTGTAAVRGQIPFCLPGLLLLERHFSESCGKAQFSGPLTHWWLLNHWLKVSKYAVWVDLVDFIDMVEPPSSLSSFLWDSLTLGTPNLSQTFRADHHLGIVLLFLNK